MDLPIALKFIIAFLLGSVIGIERQLNEKKTVDVKNRPAAILGLRTFSLVSILGAIVGVLYGNYSGLSLIISTGFLFLLLSFYILDSRQTRDPGITTELALLFSFLIGILISLAVIPIQLIVAVTVALLLLLAKKDEIHTLVSGIGNEELNAFLTYAIIAAVILPFLPNETYTVGDLPAVLPLLENFHINTAVYTSIELLNPFKLWLIVALITGVDLLGHILERTVGSRRGWMMASIAGGFISSTATTQSLAIQSRQTINSDHLVAAALLSNLVSFFQIALLLSPVNIGFVARVLPSLALMVCVGLILTWFFIRRTSGKKSKEKSGKQYHDSHIVDIFSALKFTGLFLCVSVASKSALMFLGNTGFLAAVGLGGMVGLDAVMINTAQLAGSDIDYRLALIAFLLANAVNLLSKSLYSFLHGSKNFARKFFFSTLVLVASSLIGLFFV